MKTPKQIRHACQILRSRLDFEQASFRLPSKQSKGERKDTRAVKESTRLYFDTWIHPLLNAIEEGDLEYIRTIGRGEEPKPIQQIDLDEEDDEDEPW